MACNLILPDGARVPLSPTVDLVQAEAEMAAELARDEASSALVDAVRSYLRQLGPERLRRLDDALIDFDIADGLWRSLRDCGE